MSIDVYGVRENVRVCDEVYVQVSEEKVQLSGVELFTLTDTQSLTAVSLWIVRKCACVCWGYTCR